MTSAHLLLLHLRLRTDTHPRGVSAGQSEVRPNVRPSHPFARAMKTDSFFVLQVSRRGRHPVQAVSGDATRSTHALQSLPRSNRRVRVTPQLCPTGSASPETRNHSIKVSPLTTNHVSCRPARLPELTSMACLTVSPRGDHHRRSRHSPRPPESVSHRNLAQPMP